MVARAQSYQDDKISAALGHKRITSCVLESWNEADTAGTVDDEEKKNHVSLKLFIKRYIEYRPNQSNASAHGYSLNFTDFI
jgi:hypothetical protein